MIKICYSDTRKLRSIEVQRNLAETQKFIQTKELAMRLQVKKISGISSETSGRWFVNDEHIIEHMLDRGLELEPNSETAGLSFVPVGVDLLINIVENREYKLILVFASGAEETLDIGTVSEETQPLCDKPLLLSGLYLEKSEVVCGDQFVAGVKNFRRVF
ncbi:MAG: hypothetical protein PHS53_01430 [Candidatus Pacebacteria bacterium]|nr:hypothetical protein [Candidatus Paceibacterota bacterium]MDD5356793.1 hypothetical protein [Candidatus Paceibacterota bacterium]